jgi:hypothetical protein
MRFHPREHNQFSERDHTKSVILENKLWVS